MIENFTNVLITKSLRLRATTKRATTKRATTKRATTSRGTSSRLASVGFITTPAPNDSRYFHVMYPLTTPNIFPRLKSILFPFLLLLITLPARTQPQLDAYEDGVYRDYIKSVRMHVTGLALTLPMTTLGLQNSLFLSFDELDGQGTRYYYTAIHCDRNWQPTQELSPMDYLEGYREGEIRDYEISSGTTQHYLHYKITVPNEELSWNISGNYLLVIYEEGFEDDPIITRRFVVSENIIAIDPDLVRPANVALRNTHQEIEFALNIEKVNTSNPRAEISCVLFQNGRWETAITDIQPRLINGPELRYDYPDKLVFEAGKEFRNLDVSSLKYRSENVLDVEEYDDGYSTILFPDEPRAYKTYIWNRDLNGMYVPYNRDYNRKYISPDSLASALALVDRYNYREQFLGTEYTEVLATLDIPNDSEKSIYVVGAMTDWKMLPEYKMEYDQHIRAYTVHMYLKQGYYNFQYAVPDKNGKVDFTTLEGNWHEAENLYTLLAYFRPRGGQYDRIIGGLTFDTSY